MTVTEEKFSSDLPLSPEILVPRLGESLVEAKKITPQQLDRALSFQAEQKSRGKQIRLGQALRALGFIDAETLEEAVTVQILQLQTALKRANQDLEQRVQDRTRELRLALDRLTELNQVKANFIANVSHELRTPLTLMKGYLELISDGGFGPLTPEQAEAVETMRRSEARLEKLIEDLILFSYSEKGKLTLELVSVNIKELIQLVVQDAQSNAMAAGIDLKTKIHDSLPDVRCDRPKIGWVIGELIQNASKFTPKGGQVYVEAKGWGDKVSIAVSDTGIGIPNERRREIFEPFHQLDGSSTRRYGGTGLGLALAGRIIAAHGAQILVRSQVGKGARFEFSLPVQPREEIRE